MMKINAFLLSFVLIFLYVAAWDLSQVFNASDCPDSPCNASRVCDTDGCPVKPGKRYYIQAADGSVGNLGLGDDAIVTCPATVIRDPHNIIMGLPVQFWVTNASDFDFLVNTSRAYINFPDGETGCKDSGTYWHATYIGGIVEKLFVYAGSLDSPPHILQRFSFIRSGDETAYTLAVCLASPNRACLPLGLADLNGETQLVASNQPDHIPYEVVFSRDKSGDGQGFIKLSK